MFTGTQSRVDETHVPSRTVRHRAAAGDDAMTPSVQLQHHSYGASP